MKRNLIYVSIFTSLLVILSGCDVNLFETVDGTPGPGNRSTQDLSDSAKADPEAFLDDVDRWVASGDLDEDEVDNVSGALETLYTDDSVPEQTQQQAMAKAGMLNATANEDVVEVANNVLDVLDELDNGSGPEPESLIETLFAGSEVTSDRQAAEDFVAALNDAEKHFAALAQSNPAENDPGLNSGEAGDVAQMALLSLVVGSVDDAALVNIMLGDATEEDTQALAGSFEQLDSQGEDISNILAYLGVPEGFVQ
jgi:uncharacterized protein (UPF0147 family)